MNVTTLRSSRRHQAIAVAVAIALIAVLWLIFAGGKKEMPSPPPVPVGVMRAEQRDVPHMASGIGTVESLHNVTLRPQVEGVLAEVLFQEGQMVRKGDLLARIDDRPFAAALAQAQAEKARNQAQLRAAEQDLTRYQNLVKEEAISRQTARGAIGTATMPVLPSANSSSTSRLELLDTMTARSSNLSPSASRLEARRLTRLLASLHVQWLSL